MSDEGPVIYDSPFEPRFSAGDRPEYTEKEAKAMQNKMLYSKYDVGVIGKVVGYHGYREADRTVYALDVHWTRVPTGHRSEETILVKRDIGRRVELLCGVRAMLAEREWFHHQLVRNQQRPSQTPHRGR